MGQPRIAAAALTVALALIGTTVFELTHRIVEKSIRHRLELALALKQAILNDWLEDSRSALAAWTDDAEFLDAVDRWARRPDDSAAKEAVIHSMMRSARELQYIAVALCRQDCSSPLLVTGRDGPSVARAALEHSSADDRFVAIRRELRGQEPGLAVVTVPDPSHEIARMATPNTGDGRGELAASIVVQRGRSLVPLESIQLQGAEPPTTLHLRKGQALKTDGALMRLGDSNGSVLLAQAAVIGGTRWVALATIDENRAFAVLHNDVVIVVLLGVLFTGVGTLWVVVVRQRTNERHAELLAEAERASLAVGQTQRVVEAQELERRRIASQLHDETGASLAAVQLNLQTLLRRKAVSDPEDAELMQETNQVLASTIAQFREFVSGLRPPEIVPGDLRRAITTEATRFSRRTGARVELDLDRFDDVLPPESAYNLYRIVYEALNNCAKYAQSTKVIVRLATEVDGSWRAAVIDNGVGFEFDQVRRSNGGHGLLIMRERAEAIGGTLQIESATGRGCIVQLWGPPGAGGAPGDPAPAATLGRSRSPTDPPISALRLHPPAEET